MDCGRSLVDRGSRSPLNGMEGMLTEIERLMERMLERRRRVQGVDCLAFRELGPTAFPKMGSGAEEDCLYKRHAKSRATIASTIGYVESGRS